MFIQQRATGNRPCQLSFPWIDLLSRKQDRTTDTASVLVGSPFLANFDQPSSGHFHQSLDFSGCPIEILDTKCINGHILHSESQKEAEHSLECFESFFVAYAERDGEGCGVTTVTVHYESYMLGKRKEGQRRDEECAKVGMQHGGEEVRQYWGQ